MNTFFLQKLKKYKIVFCYVSVVVIATGYGLVGPGIESRWRRDFPHLSRPALVSTQPPAQWTPGLFRGKERSVRDADPSRILVPWSRKSRATPLLSLWTVRAVQSLSASTRVHFTLDFFYCYVDCNQNTILLSPSLVTQRNVLHKNKIKI